MPDNLARMIKLANEFFETKNDPSQISVNEDVIKKLRDIHSGTLTQDENADGPIAWILLIPTTEEVMRDFLDNKINEQELLERTASGVQYQAIYLCSALVLPEYRRKGIAVRLTIEAIQSIKKDHPIRYLYYWSFSLEGDHVVTSVASKIGLPVLKKG